MKNLLIVHLESLNYQNYMLNREKIFPNLCKIEKECTYFHNYYSTATSTLMVIGDLMYGSTKQYESSATLNDIPMNYKIKISLFDDLKAYNYDTGIFVYPTGGDLKESNDRHLVGMNNSIEIIPNYEEYIKRCKKIINTDRFALMSCNFISNLSICLHLDVADKSLGDNYWQMGFDLMDKCCGELWDYLKTTGKLKDTVVVFYGDHGDDYWGHGYHGGLAHAIEPNNLLVHTPLMIYSSQKNSLEANNMIQTTDLRKIITKLVWDKNIEKLDRKYCFSRNEYSCQELRRDTFNKGYACTDGEYMLCVTHDGLTMYYTKMDNSCTNNLLKYALLQNEVLKFIVESKHIERHLKEFLNHRNQRIFRRKFYELKDVLYSWVCEMYAAGNRTEEDVNQEMNFNQINGN